MYGIDLGTTYACIATMNHQGDAVVAPNADHKPVTPTMVFFKKPDHVIVGRLARDAAERKPDRVVELVIDHHWDFHFKEKKYRSVDIATLILRQIVRDAQKAGATPGHDAVLTHPAFFKKEQKEILSKAGHAAGLHILSIIPEAIAAACCLGLDKEEDQDVLVFDLGGGSFKTSSLGVREGIFQILGSNHDPQLGGHAWTHELASLLARQIARKKNMDDQHTIDDQRFRRQILNAAERFKMDLTTRASFTREVPYGEDHFSLTVTLEDFETATRPLLEKVLSFSEQALVHYRAMYSERNLKIILVGSSASMPQIPRAFRERFPREHIVSAPNHAVAKGAALYGQKKSLEQSFDDVMKHLAGFNPDPLEDGASSETYDPTPSPLDQTIDQTQQAGSARQEGVSKSDELNLFLILKIDPTVTDWDEIKPLIKKRKDSWQRDPSITFAQKRKFAHFIKKCEAALEDPETRDTFLEKERNKLILEPSTRHGENTTRTIQGAPLIEKNQADPAETSLSTSQPSKVQTRNLHRPREKSAINPDKVKESSGDDFKHPPPPKKKPACQDTPLAPLVASVPLDHAVRITGLRSRLDGRDMVLTWNWPRGVEEVLIAYRYDDYPTDPRDQHALTIRVTRDAFHESGHWVLRVKTPEPHYFKFYTRFPGQGSYDQGVAFKESLGDQISVRYELVKRKHWIKRTVVDAYLKLQSSDCNQIQGLKIIGKPNHVPVHGRDGLLLVKITRIELVDRLAHVPIPESFYGKRLYLKLFFEDPEQANHIRLIPANKDRLFLD